MSSKRINYCDRCGKEIPSNVHPRRMFWTRTFVRSNLSYTLNRDEDDLDISDCIDSFDLCKECSESFAKWFKDGKRGEKK